MKKILVLGANPAWQKTLFFRDFVYGEVNRSIRMEAFPSGKGINFCRAAKIWNGVETELFQFTGGENGKAICSGLEQENLRAVSIPTAGATRCCITCLDETTHTMTELIEPSHAVSDAEAVQMLAEFECALPDAAAAAVCGSLPDGSNYNIYTRMAAAAHRAGLPVLFDVCKGIEPCFDTGMNYLKINREELAKLTGAADLRAGLKALFARFKVEFAAITDGAANAYATDGKVLYTYTLPEVAEVVNPIGCGDTASAVFWSETVSGTPAETAFQRALGAASANCMTALPGSYDRETAQELAGKIQISAGEL